MRGISEISGVRSIRSMHSSGKRSIPRVQSSAYLDLYMLPKEKDRLEKVIFVLDKRRNTANRQLDGINKRIEKLQKETHEEQKIKTYRSVPTRPLKTMAINY